VGTTKLLEGHDSPHRIIVVALMSPDREHLVNESVLMTNVDGVLAIVKEKMSRNFI